MLDYLIIAFAGFVVLYLPSVMEASQRVEVGRTIWEAEALQLHYVFEILMVGLILAMAFKIYGA